MARTCFQELQSEILPAPQQPFGAELERDTLDRERESEAP